MGIRDRREVPMGRGRQQEPDATVAEHSWETDPGDHCETSLQAYRHVELFLAGIAQKLGKPRDQLKIYDPYFCQGGMKAHLARLGFSSVHNKNHDFYDVVKNKKVPVYDVLVTSPPYSVDHMQRLAELMATKKKPWNKPWMLLLPDFVHRKKYYAASLEGHAPFFVVPSDKYQYYSIKGGRANNPQVCRHWKRSGECPMRDSCGFLHTDDPRAVEAAKRLQASESPYLLAPYHSFWHIHLDDSHLEQQLIQQWRALPPKKRANCELLRDQAQLDMHLELLKPKRGLGAKRALEGDEGEPVVSEQQAREQARERVRMKKMRTEEAKARKRAVREAEMKALRGE
eukprot:TRINITY_DN7558_c0_g1_i1.p1 TRINITY_DN7558_c0_g1~~TRINITY_DN7558_c0_g1_i1.p1  ORF type:complete len:350 (+),score=88.52 TRINITY_DN7558_c0_g1_i1:27-1052(+)